MQPPTKPKKNFSRVPGSNSMATGNEFTPALSRAFRERLRPCLNSLDSLRVQGLQKEISLPAIAVVGDQSVGKSSVLESISGVEFPRGTGIVTRCPLMLSMRSRDDDKWLAKIRYETRSGELREKPIRSSQDIGDAIREAQNEIAGPGGDISDNLIEMWVESADSPDLTLIDLPGIARYSAELGSNVASITKSLILHYIEKPEVIILVVVPCHVDIETVEALSLAKQVDPSSQRTIGVLTCPDLVNPGSESEVLEMMRNQKIPLKKGYVTVRCRTPQQLKENVGLREATQQEEQFFKRHQYFSSLDEFEFGSKTLAVKLSTELYEAIKNNVPDMIREIHTKREEFSKMLEQLGTGPPDSEDEMKQLLVRLITQFTKEFTNVATGTHRHEPDRLFGRCRTHWETLADDVHAAAFAQNPNGSELKASICQEIVEQRGCELPGFDNVHPVLERVVINNFLVHVREPSSKLLVSVDQEVGDTTRALTDRIFSDYPALNELIKQNCETVRSEMVAKARKNLHKLFKQEQYVFTQDRIFEYEKAYPSESDSVQIRQRGSDPSSMLDTSTERVIDGVKCYLRVAVRRLQDTIPLTVMHFLLHNMSSILSERLIALITDTAPLYERLQQENPDISTKRRQLKERLANLAEAEMELAKF